MNSKSKIASFVLLLLGLWYFLPNLFQPQSINSMLAWIPIVLLLALGEMMVILTGGIDVSVGSILGLSAMVLGLSVSHQLGLPIWAQALLCLGVGALLGSLNWLLISVAKIQPLIATIATLATFRGISFLSGGGKTITGSMLPDCLLNLSGQGVQLGSVTVSWLLMVASAIALIVGFFLIRTSVGRSLYAFGSQPSGAFRRGISPAKIQWIAYSTSGMLAGLAGAFYASRYGLVHPGTAGEGLELTAIAAVVIGGTKLTGGSGSVLGVVASCAFLAVLNVGLSVAGIGADWQLFFYGLVLLFALGLDRRNKRALEVATA